MKAALDAPPDLKEVVAVIKGLKRVELCVIASREGEEYGERPLYLIAWYDVDAGEATMWVGDGASAGNRAEKEDKMALEICQRKTVGRWKVTALPTFTAMDQAKRAAVSARNAILRERKINESLSLFKRSG